MKKILIIMTAACITACGGSVNECPVGAYGTHEWHMVSYGNDYHIEKCSYCDRHRRVPYDEHKPYVYEDMSTGDLSIEIERAFVKK